MLLVKIPCKTKLRTTTVFYCFSMKRWNGRSWEIWPGSRYYSLGTCSLPPFTRLADLQMKVKLSRQLFSQTPEWDQLSPAQAVHSLVPSTHPGLSDAAGGAPAPLSQPICFRNLFRVPSTSSLFASAFVVKARNPEELLSPSQSSLNLLPPTSSAQPAAEVSHALTSAGQSTSSRKLCLLMGNAIIIWPSRLVVTAFILSVSRFLVLYHL